MRERDAVLVPTAFDAERVYGRFPVVSGVTLMDPARVLVVRFRASPEITTEEAFVTLQERVALPPWVRVLGEEEKEETEGESV